MTLLTHPSLQGIRSGSGYSGSTAWHDAFRFRQYLRAAQEDTDEPVDPANDSGLRELTFMKIQYGPPAAKLTLRWRNGFFLPESGGGPMKKWPKTPRPKRSSICSTASPQQGRNVGAALTSPNYAPTVFAKEGCGINRKQFEAAMRRLFAARKIHVANYGKASNQHQKLVRGVVAPRPAPVQLPSTLRKHRGLSPPAL